MGGQQFLVGGDHGFSGRQRRLDEPPGRIDASDELDHHVHARIADEPLGVPGDQRGRYAGPRSRRVAHGDPDQLEAHARASSDGIGVAEQERDEGAADVAAPEHGHAHGRLSPVMAGSGYDPAVVRPRHQLTLPPTGIRASHTACVAPATASPVETDQVVVGLAPDDHPGVTVGDEHHGGPGHLVVVRGHRVAVGAGDRGGHDVAHDHVGG